MQADSKCNTRLLKEIENSKTKQNHIEMYNQTSQFDMLQLEERCRNDKIIIGGGEKIL